LVDRFKPRRWLNDCAPYHYILGQVGAMVMTADLDEDLGRNKWRADRAIALGSSQRLEHQIGVNQFFIDLMKEERRRPEEVRMTEWWSEARCANAMAGIVYPDAYGVWEEAGRRLEFLLEYDRGTESLDRLAAKLEGYHLRVPRGYAQFPSKIWSGRPDSNRRPSPWQGDALPTEPRPQ
jgi:hypothetical protein